MQSNTQCLRVRVHVKVLAYALVFDFERVVLCVGVLVCEPFSSTTSTPSGASSFPFLPGADDDAGDEDGPRLHPYMYRSQRHRQRHHN